MFDEQIGTCIQLLHGIEQRLIRFIACVEHAFVAVLVTGIGAWISGVVVHVFKPVPTDACFGLKQRKGEVLIEGTALGLCLHQPASAGGVGHAAVGSFGVELGDEAGFARPFEPVVEILLLWGPDVVVVDGNGIAPAACGTPGGGAVHGGIVEA